MVKCTPLYEFHKNLGARMTEFEGWSMPVQYGSIRDEHQAVRKQVGLFDISHMGEITVEGRGAFEAVQSLTCNDLSRLTPGQCQYSALLTPEGTFVDDIIVYPLAPERILICVNAGNTDKDFEWIRSHAPADVTVRNESAHWCQLAVQGPQSEAVLQQLIGENVNQLQRFHFMVAQIAGVESLLSRTGYTGEDGFEIYAPESSAGDLWQRLMAAGNRYGMSPCGLGARDTLRLEVAYPLYGHEIDDKTNPYEARLGWIVKLNKTDFIGKTALEKIKAEGAQRQLFGFQMDDRSIPRAGYPILLDDTPTGTVASGTLSPSLNIGIGTGFLPVGSQQPKIAIDIRGKKEKQRSFRYRFLGEQMSKIAIP